MANPSIDLGWLEAIEDFVKSVGIPAAVCFWLLWKTDKRLDRLTERIDELVKKP